jgi:hypothetical protein
MALIDSVFNNFASHVTSGLSRFILIAYEACERASVSRLSLQIIPQELPEELASDAELVASIRRLREKFSEILVKESNTSLSDVASLTVEVDFAPDSTQVEERRRMLAAIPVYYGYDPVYHCTLAVRMHSGVKRSTTMRDLLSVSA